MSHHAAGHEKLLLGFTGTDDNQAGLPRIKMRRPYSRGRHHARVHVFLPADPRGPYYQEQYTFFD